MRKYILLLAACLLVAGCDGYTQAGVSTSTRRSLGGGEQQVKIGRANGMATLSIEDDDASDSLLEVDVTLAAGKGSYKIELLGKDASVTLTLESRDGKTVTGHGQMACDAFGDADYRVTAVEAENVAYTLKYTYR